MRVLLADDDDDDDEIELCRAAAQRLSGGDSSSLLSLLRPEVSEEEEEDRPPTAPSSAGHTAEFMQHCRALLELGPGQPQQDGWPVALGMDSVLAACRVALVNWEAANRAQNYTEEQE